MSEPIRIGLVGLGRAGKGMHYNEIIKRKEKYTFYAVCDIIEERTKPFVEEFGSKPYTSYEEMLKDPGVELVSIATRSCDHYKHAKMALLAGKSVMLEKPFCMHADECKDLIALGSQPAGPHLYIRHNRRFEKGFNVALDIIKSGKLGRVYEVKLTRNRYHRRNDWQTINEFGGGQLLNWGPHIIDHALRFCGGAYKDMYSEIRHVAAAGDCEDHIKIVFTGINDCIVDMEISGGAALPSPEYLIYGSKGALVSEGNTFKLRYLDPDVELAPIKADRETPGVSASFGNDEKLTWVEEIIELGNEEMDCIWDDLYEAIKNDAKFRIGNDEALAVLEVIEKVKAGTIFENK